MAIDFVTIGAGNYLPYIQVLTESITNHEPFSRIFVLIVDAETRTLSLPGNIDVITPADLDLDREEFLRMAMMYGIRELCTAMKPWAMEYAMEHGIGRAVYLDPDIQVFGRLDSVDEALDAAPIVLTPHRLTPTPQDGLLPNEEAFLLAGSYNLGFIGLTRGAVPFLDWWKSRLARFAIDAPHAGYFTDQRWIDLAPSLFSTYILKDPAVNVAYWNLDERNLARDGETWIIDGRPLTFFHFSGFRVNRPWELAEYTAPNPRICPSDVAVLPDLLGQYADRLRTAGADHTCGLARPGFATLGDGTLITPAMRNAFRTAVLHADFAGEPLPTAPFHATGDGTCLDWGSMAIVPNSPVTNGVLAVWRTRPDLQDLVPDPWHPQAEFLKTWAVNWGVAEGAIPKAWSVPAQVETTQPPISQTVALPGFNVWGYFGAELGVGEASRLMADTIATSSIPHTLQRLTGTVNRQTVAFRDFEEEPIYSVDLVVANADRMSLWSAENGWKPRRYTIGLWSWEIESFPPSMHPAFDLVDEVWANSTFARDAIAKHSNRPVLVAPIDVSHDLTEAPMLDRGSIGLPPDLPYFLFMFDYNSDFARKNPMAVVEAFQRAFPSEGGVRLVVKSINGSLHRRRREQLRYAASLDRRVVLIENYLNHDQRLALLAHCAAYVSLHRAEGLGLTMLEAMSLGRPVLATGYSGNMDFMDDSNSVIVPFDMIPIADSDYYPWASIWAEPMLDPAADAMRKVFDQPLWAAELGTRAQDAVHARRENSAEFLRERLAALTVQSRSSPRSVRRSSPRGLPGAQSLSSKLTRQLVRRVGSVPRMGA